LRRGAKPFVEAAHVGAPHGVGRDVDEKLEGQRLLIIEIVHVGRRHFVGRATTDVFPDAAAQLLRILVEIETLVAEGHARPEHLRERDVGHRRERREQPGGVAEAREQPARFRRLDHFVRYAVETQQQAAGSRLTRPAGRILLHRFTSILVSRQLYVSSG
jgi:hypothetical protein